MAAAERIAACDAVLDRLAGEDRFSGAAMVTQHGDQVLAKAYGFASHAWNSPCTLRTRFDAASVTKLGRIALAMPAEVEDRQ